MYYKNVILILRYIITGKKPSGGLIDLKKVAVFCLIVMLTLSLFAASALAFTDYTGAIQFTGNADGAAAAMLFDANSGMILYQKNIDQQMEPASTTKILTLLIALEQGNMEDVVTITSDETYPTIRGSKLGIIKNEEIIFKDLINGMMMASGNDAAVAVADHMAGSVEPFAVKMNAKATEIGLTNSNFVTPHGMHHEGHYSTARDMALLTTYALQNPQFVQIVSQKSYTMPSDNKHTAAWVVDNTNKLLLPDEPYYYQYAAGIKTGSTTAAGDCLVSAATRDNMNLVCLIFNTEDPLRWTLSKELFEWGFENFKTVDITTLLAKADPVQATVENAAASDSGVLDFNMPEAGTAYVTLDKATVDGIMNGTDSITVEMAFNPDPLQAPIAKDDIVGTVTYKSAGTGTVLFAGSLIASRDVPSSAPGTSGATAVETQKPVPPGPIEPKGDASIWWWLLLPGALIAFLVIRLLTTNRRKHKRFKHHQPHYSYKIKR